MIIISLAMCLCGCTKKNQEGQLSKIYKVPQKLIYINAPSTYEETQNGYSKIYFVKNKKYIADEIENVGVNEYKRNIDKKLKGFEIDREAR